MKKDAQKIKKQEFSNRLFDILQPLNIAEKDLEEIETIRQELKK